MTLFIALLFHSFGDVLLEIERVQLFLPAVGAFMLGHVFYILTFKADITSIHGLSATRKMSASAVIVFAIIVGIILVPHLEALLLAPVVLYVIAISSMAIFTFLANYRTAWISIGAISYLLSDSIIAINTFVHPFSESTYIIWPMYYLG